MQEPDPLKEWGNLHVVERADDLTSRVLDVALVLFVVKTGQLKTLTMPSAATAEAYRECAEPQFGRG